MACSITIDFGSTVAYLGEGGSSPATIHVSGTAEECEVVEVRFTSPQSGVVSALVNEGAWLAVFNAPDDFDPSDFACGTLAMKVRAACKGDPSCVVEGGVDSLQCQPRNCPPQAVAVVYEGGDPGDLVDPAGCLSPGVYTVGIVDPLSDTAVYQWSLDGVTQAAASGAGQTEFQLLIEAGGDPRTVTAVIAYSLDCLLSAGVTLTPCPPVSPDCPGAVVLEVAQGDGAPVDVDAGCLEAGSWTVRVVEPQGSGATYTWSVANALQEGETASALTVELLPGSTLAIQVSVAEGDCPPIPGSVLLEACPPEPECPEVVTWHVEDPGGQRVALDGCVTPGSYMVVVDDPVGADVVYTWQIDGQPQAGEDGPALPVVVEPGLEVIVEVEIRLSRCPPIGERVGLVGCQEDPTVCPDALVLVVRNGSGSVVDTDEACLPAGSYALRVEDPSGPGLTRSWSVDGQLQPTATGPVFDVNLGEGEVVDIGVSVSRAGCPPVPGGVTLRGCSPTTPPPTGRPAAPWWCPVLFYTGLVLFLLGLVLIFGGLCSSNPVGWVVAVIGGVMTAVGFGLLVAWAVLCAPARGGCGLLASLIQFLGVLTILLGIVAAAFGIIALICGLVTSPTGILAVLCGLPGACGLGAAIDFGIVGVLTSILILIYFRIGCD